ncbi:MAG: hypothetical protein R2867_43635 [Caldilineaceae bacterium]
MVIENEAPSVATTAVNLYIYDPAVGEGLQGMGPAVDMMVANDPDFTDASWEPFTQEKKWTLLEGEGWRFVYVMRRDAFGRTSTVFDTVYLGDTLPTQVLDLQQACSSHLRVRVDSLEKTGWPQIQFSLNWQGDNADTTFQDTQNIGQTVNDEHAIGTNAYHLPNGTGGHVRYWTTTFYKDHPFVAYFRVKATNTTTADPVLTISVVGGGTEYGPLVLKGTDFRDPTAYQEFVIPFQFDSNGEDPYLIFNFQHTGASDVYLDTISIFTEAMPINAELTWPVVEGYHRSRGIWARFVQEDGVFTEPTDLQIFGANAAIAVPPVENVPPMAVVAPSPDLAALTYQLFLPVTRR